MIGIILCIICAFACYKLAEQKGKNLIVAMLCGFFFHLFAVVYYWFVSPNFELSQFLFGKLISKNDSDTNSTNQPVPAQKPTPKPVVKASPTYVPSDSEKNKKAKAAEPKVDRTTGDLTSSGIDVEETK